MIIDSQLNDKNIKICMAHLHFSQAMFVFNYVFMRKIDHLKKRTILLNI